MDVLENLDTFRAVSEICVAFDDAAHTGGMRTVWRGAVFNGSVLYRNL